MTNALLSHLTLAKMGVGSMKPAGMRQQNMTLRGGRSAVVGISPPLRRACLAWSWSWLAAVFLVAGCGDDDRPPDRPERLRIGILPDQSEAALHASFSDIRDYLSKQLGIPCELVIAETYEGAVDDLVAGRTDISRFTLLLARQRSEVVPLVMRDVDRHFSSVFLVAKKDRDRKLADFKDARLAFGSAYSTSGHLMPRHFLKQEGIIAEEFFSSVTYAGGHDDTAALVQDGEADLGAANAVVVQRLFRDGTLDPDKVVILKETPPYADYNWAARGDLPEILIQEIRAAFLGLSRLDPDHARLLDNHHARTYLPAALANFKSVEQALRSLPPDHPGREELVRR